MAASRSTTVVEVLLILAVAAVECNSTLVMGATGNLKIRSDDGEVMKKMTWPQVGDVITEEWAQEKRAHNAYHGAGDAGDYIAKIAKELRAKAYETASEATDEVKKICSQVKDKTCGGANKAKHVKDTIVDDAKEKGRETMSPGHLDEEL